MAMGVEDVGEGETMTRIALRTSCRSASIFHALALLFTTSCGQTDFPGALLVAAPVMLGPIDRIGGQSTPSNGPTTIDAVMYQERGYSTKNNLVYALRTTVAAQMAAEHAPPKSTTVRIDEVAVGDYLMWTIPYLTPIVLLRHTRVNPSGRLQVEKQP